MDITQIILDQHHEQRQLFAFIREVDPADHESLSALWDRLSGLLDAHAEGEERFFYPRLLKKGRGAADADSAADETRDAIKDHNDIRDTASAVGKQKIGSDKWFAAVVEADIANSKHMAEEERQGLSDFRSNATIDERHSLGVKFLAFVSGHLLGVPPVDKDPDTYVKDHQG
ncbi:MAG: hemerythrin domain-containing protein [Sphingomicrobium sp.]